jgi:hypothetical protein
MSSAYSFYSTYRNLDVPLANGLVVSGLDVHEYRNARTYFAKRAPGGKPARNDFDVFDGMDRGWYPLWARLKKATVKQVGMFGLVVQAKPATGGASAADYTEEIDDCDDLSQLAAVVRLRSFAGLTIEQAAQALGVSTSTADNDWAYARCWLRLEVEGGRHDEGPSSV